MTNRERFINYIKTGEGKFICSPQIGAGAGFDTKLAGKTWFSQTTYEDTKHACEQFDMIPLYNFGLPDLTSLTPDIHWEAWTGAYQAPPSMGFSRQQYWSGVDQRLHPALSP